MKERRKEVKEELSGGQSAVEMGSSDANRNRNTILNKSRRANIVIIVTLVIFGMTDRSTAPDSPPTDTLTLANAKARLSEVVDRAQTGPQIITRHGRPNAVVVSADEWARKTARKGTLAEFLLASPLRGADLELERVQDEPRDEMP
jgi:prevent-host-death family protein